MQSRLLKYCKIYLKVRGITCHFEQKRVHHSHCCNLLVYFKKCFLIIFIQLNARLSSSVLTNYFNCRLFYARMTFH